jgi:hypothetical protein
MPVDKARLETQIGAKFGSNDKNQIADVTKAIVSSLSVKQQVIALLQEQGLPKSAVTTAPVNSLALAYIIPNYLRSWRNRVNPNWALLGGDDDISDLDTDAFGKDEPKPESSAIPAATPSTEADSVAALRDLYRQIETAVDGMIYEKIKNSTVKLDPGAKDQIRSLATEATNTAIAEYLAANAKPRVIEILNPLTAESINIGLQHEKFPTLLRAAQAKDPKGFRLNIWLTGPTGSGKTTAAQAVAKALSFDFGSDGSLDADYKVLGFRDANGHIVSTQFLKIYENGGIYLADEIDNWLPSALLSLNAALANGFISTPGGMITRHKDCVVIACANTWGHGATNEYVGRTKQDAATLDRFQPKIHWPIDEGLEGAIAEATAGPIGAAWHKVIVTARANVARQGLKIIISPRATLSGIALLQAGFSVDDVIDMTFAAGIAPEQFKTIKPSRDTIQAVTDAINSNTAPDVKQPEAETEESLGKEIPNIPIKKYTYDQTVSSTLGEIYKEMLDMVERNA